MDLKNWVLAGRWLSQPRKGGESPPDEEGVSEVCVGGLQGHVCEAAAHVMGRTGVPGGPRALARCDVRVSTFREGL